VRLDTGNRGTDVFSGADFFGVTGNGVFGLPLKGISEPGAMLYGGGVNDVVYPGSKLEVVSIPPPYPQNEANPIFPEIRLDFELYSENTDVAKGTKIITPTELGNRLRELMV
jgi:hypothetical protein